MKPGLQKAGETLKGLQFSRKVRLPATWRPDPYQDWSFTSKQTMTFQDTPRFVGQAEFILKQIMDYSSEPLRATSSTNFGAISLNHNPTLP